MGHSAERDGHPIAATLTAERERQGLSMGVIAARVGASKSSVHDWEHGVKCPSLDNAGAWAEALGYRLVAVPCMSLPPMPTRLTPPAEPGADR